MHRGHTTALATLTRVPTDCLSFDFRLEAGLLPAERLTYWLQCAIATREVLVSGLEGAVRVCLLQDWRSASSTSGSTTHSDLRHTVDSSLMTRYRARSSILFSRKESGLLIDKYVRFFNTSAT